MTQILCTPYIMSSLYMFKHCIIMYRSRYNRTGELMLRINIERYMSNKQSSTVVTEQTSEHMHVHIFDPIKGHKP